MCECLVKVHSKVCVRIPKSPIRFLFSSVPCTLWRPATNVWLCAKRREMEKLNRTPLMNLQSSNTCISDFGRFCTCERRDPHTYSAHSSSYTFRGWNLLLSKDKKKCSLSPVYTDVCSVRIHSLFCGWIFDFDKGEIQ